MLAWNWSQQLRKIDVPSNGRVSGARGTAAPVQCRAETMIGRFGIAREFTAGHGAILLR